MLGFPLDPAKSEDNKLIMTILGSEVCMDDEKAWSSVDSPKAEKWSQDLLKVLEEGRLDSHMASKLAGRLSFATQCETHGNGRACVKPFYAQANAPLKWCSPALLQSMRWWLTYLELRPHTVREAAKPDRVTMKTWTDACGSTKWCSAVLYDGSSWFWTRIRPPPVIWGMPSSLGLIPK